MGYRVAVVGATGNVGREMLQILAERNFPADDVVALASATSAGKEASFGDKAILKVQDLAKFDFKGIDIVLSSPGAKVSAEHSPRAAKAGAVVIDNTSYWRMDPDVPLVVPEVNARAIAGYKGRGIIANPNCSTIQMVVALKPHPRCRDHQARRGVDLSVDVGRRQGGHGRAAEPDQELLREPDAGAPEVHQVDRLQRHSPYRRLHGRRLDQGRMEDGGRDQEDPRPQDQGPRDLRARADLHRPRRGDQPRARESARRARGAPRAGRRSRACWWSTGANRAATSRRRK